MTISFQVIGGTLPVDKQIALDIDPKPDEQPPSHSIHDRIKSPQSGIDVFLSTFSPFTLITSSARPKSLSRPFVPISPNRC